MALSDITSSTKTYKVCKGDTFSEIAERCRNVNMPGYSGLNYTQYVKKLQSFNPDIENINLIYVGQTITLQVSSGESAPKKTTTKAQTATITAFGLQSNTDRTVFATWAWSKSNTENYKVKWLYATGDGVGFIGSESTETAKQSVYNAPQNATHVSFQVQPVSKTYKSGDNDVRYWNAGWSTVKKYYFSDNPPSTPPNPTDTDIKLGENKNSDYTITVTLNNLTDLNATSIHIQVWQDDKIYRNGTVKINNGKVSYSCTCEAGRVYKVRYRSVKGSQYSDWTAFSNDIVTIPAGTKGIYSLYMMSSSSVNITWYDDSTAESYEVQYTTQRELFDTGNTNGITSVTVGGEKDRTPRANAIISGLTSGSEYFFRVRSTNSKGFSAWTEIESIGVGKVPSAPTTWSSRTTVAVGDSLTLYWVHNTEGSSRQTGAKLELTVGSNDPIIRNLTFGTCYSTNADIIKVVNISDFVLANNTEIKVLMGFANTSDNISLNVNNLGVIPVKLSGDNTYYWDANTLVTFSYDGLNWNIIDCSPEGSATSYNIDTSEHPQGTKIKWRVRTAGIVENQDGYIYSDWSVERTVEIHAQPTLALSVFDLSGNSFDQLTSLPFSISALAGPAIQTPISYVVSITSNEAYETVDNIGNPQIIKAGDEVYYAYFDTSANPLSVDISANNVSLRNNISYTVTCTVAMDSGLTGESSAEFTVSWEDDELWPDAEIVYDKNTFTTLIKPYCIDSESNKIIEDVTLSVYRREFDGSYTELATGLDNEEGTYITDPHPSLDYARYRIVAVKNSTGALPFIRVSLSRLHQTYRVYKHFLYNSLTNY